MAKFDVLESPTASAVFLSGKEDIIVGCTPFVGLVERFWVSQSGPEDVDEPVAGPSEGTMFERPCGNLPRSTVARLVLAPPAGVGSGRLRVGDGVFDDGATYACPVCIFGKGFFVAVDVGVFTFGRVGIRCGEFAGGKAGGFAFAPGVGWGSGRGPGVGGAACGSGGGGACTWAWD